MNELATKLDLVEKKLLELKRCKDQIDRNTDQTDSNKSEIERLHERLKTEHYNERKENYSQFAEKKSKNLFTTNNEIQYVRPFKMSNFACIESNCMQNNRIKMQSEPSVTIQFDACNSGRSLL